jgi:hypothetical protein
VGRRRERIVTHGVFLVNALLVRALAGVCLVVLAGVAGAARSADASPNRVGALVAVAVLAIAVGVPLEIQEGMFASLLQSSNSPWCGDDLPKRELRWSPFLSTNDR